MDINIILHYLIGGVIKEYNVLLFFCGIILVYILIEVYSIPAGIYNKGIARSPVQIFIKSFRDIFVNVFGLIRTIFVVYLSIVLIVNYFGLPIWMWFIITLVLMVMAIILVVRRSSKFKYDDNLSPIHNFNLYAKRHNLSIKIGIETNFLAMITGATLVYFLTVNFNIIFRIILIFIVIYFINIMSHLFYNNIVKFFSKDKPNLYMDIASPMPEEETVRDFWG